MITNKKDLDGTKNGVKITVDKYNSIDRTPYDVWLHPDGPLNDNLGFRHRLDGPAYENDEGNRAWFFCGNLHRLDGPSVERAAPSLWFKKLQYHINGVEYDTFQSYLKAVKPLITEQEYFILVLTYGAEK